MPMPPDYPPRLLGALPRARDPLRRRRGAVGRRPHGEDVGDRALRRRRARPARLRQVDRRRPAARGRHRPRRADGRGAAAAGSAAPSAATRSRARRRSPCSTPSREPEFLARGRPRSGDDAARAARRRCAARHDAIGEVRGLGPMLAFELAEQTPDRAKAIVDAAFERGLLLLCLRHVRQRDPAAAAAHDRRRRARAKGSALLEDALAAAAGVSDAPDIRIRGLRKRYGDVAAVDGVDLDIARGEFFTMLGPSGSGKTTTLRHDRRLRAPRRGHDRARRRGRLAPAAVRPAT